MQEQTIVIFRYYPKDEEVIALFPEIPANYAGTFCDSYMRVGQHGGADYTRVINDTTPVNRNNIKVQSIAEDLRTELTNIGYNLVEKQKITTKNIKNYEDNLRKITING